MFIFPYPPTTEPYSLSLHDALPICAGAAGLAADQLAYLRDDVGGTGLARAAVGAGTGKQKFQFDVVFSNWRSEEHTSELQSRPHLVCRLLLEKKNTERGCS